MLRNNTSPACINLDYNSGFQVPKNYIASEIDDFNTNLNRHQQSDMSSKIFPRRCTSIASTFVCIFTVLIFLWGIPCSEAYSNINPQNKSISWELPYDEIELSGVVQVVAGAIPKTKNLIFIYRGNHMKKEDKNNDDKVNGVLLIVGNSGEVGWYTREDRIPTEINCHLIDVNQDGQKDCIVSGSEGLLAVVNPLSGTYYWYIHKQGKVFSNIAAIDFPIVIKDMDKDKVNDLLTVATVYLNANHNSLLIISGATGNLIGDPITIDQCSTVRLLQATDLITYICKNGDNDTSVAVRQITYTELYKKLKVDQSNHIASASTVKKNNSLSSKKKNENTRETFVNGPGKLVIENTGECPSSCKVNLKLLLERNGTTNVSWEYSANYVYSMKPSLFAFANSIRGFVLKLSQWNSANFVKGPLKVDEVTNNMQNQSVKTNDLFIYRPSINVSSISSYTQHSNFTVHDISQRIVLISFDKFQTHIVNASQTDIVQICVRDHIDKLTSLPICQPDLEHQEISSTIGDLDDDDDTYELISYYSTFVAPGSFTPNNSNSTYNNWHLTSVVRVNRLETELSKLFVGNV